LGSIDANTGSEDLGWDTDQFPMDLHNNTMMLLAVLAKGGIAPGGFNFDAKPRRQSVALEDLFWGHVGAMDALAAALRFAARVVQDGTIPKMVSNRYSSWDGEFGRRLAAAGSASGGTLEDCENFIHINGEPTRKSGQEEKYQVALNHILMSKL